MSAPSRSFRRGIGEGEGGEMIQHNFTLTICLIIHFDVINLNGEDNESRGVIRGDGEGERGLSFSYCE